MNSRVVILHECMNAVFWEDQIKVHTNNEGVGGGGGGGDLHMMISSIATVIYLTAMQSLVHYG